MSPVPRAPSRGPHLPRLRCSRVVHLSRILFTVALIAAWLLQVAPGVRAEGEGSGGEGEVEGATGLTKTTMQLLQPFANQLSGPAWLLATGQDPRLKGMAPDLAAPGALAPGGQSNQASAASAQALVPFRSPGPAFSRNLLISRNIGDAPVQLEPSIAVDPTDPNHLVMAAIDYNLQSGMGVYTSFDGGVTWQGPSQALMHQNDFMSLGDPVLAFAPDGTVYLVQLGASAQEFEFGPIESAIMIVSINLSRSTDGGVTWSDTTRAAAGQVRVNSNVDQAGKERGTFTYDFLDKPWVAVGPDPKDHAKSRIYVTYTEFESTAGVQYADEVPFLNGVATTDTIKLVSSANGGQTWTSPVSVSPTATFAGVQSEEGDGAGASGSNETANPAAEQAKETLEGFEKALAEPDGANAQEIGVTPGTPAQRYFSGAQPKVLSDGTVVVTYMDSTADGFTQGYANLMVTTSPDAGKGWNQAVVAGTILETINARGAAFRYNGTSFPQIAIGPKDEIYIVAGSRSFTKPTDDGDIYFFASLDHGRTWSKGKKLNGDDTDRLQFFPSITVSPNGVIHAMWGDMRDDPQKVRFNIYYSESKDQGKTWGFTIPQQNFSVPDTRVSDFASNTLKGFPGGAFIGDYFSIAATNDDVFMVWPDSRLAEFGGTQQRIAFARQKAIPAPTVFLNPASGTAGRTVTIQGLGFQPDAILTISVGNVPQIQLLTDDRGNFSKTIFMPITGEGAQQVDAIDETGNVANGSFYTDFGFDTIQKELQGGAGNALPPSASPAALPSGSPAATPVGSGGPPPTPTPYTYMAPQPQQTAGAADTTGDQRTIGTFVFGMFAVGGGAWWLTRRRPRFPFR